MIVRDQAVKPRRRSHTQNLPRRNSSLFIRQFRRNFGDFPAYFLDLLLSSVPLHVPDHGLCREHRRPKELDLVLRVGATPCGPAPPSRARPRVGSVKSPVPPLPFSIRLPLPVRDPDVLLQCLNHQLCRSFCEEFKSIPVPKRPQKACSLAPDAPVPGCNSLPTTLEAETTRLVAIIARRNPDALCRFSIAGVCSLKSHRITPYCNEHTPLE